MSRLVSYHENSAGLKSTNCESAKMFLRIIYNKIQRRKRSSKDKLGFACLKILCYNIQITLKINHLQKYMEI